MTTKTTRDLTAQIAYLTRALKAPTLRESVPRLAERARTESWTHEEFLAACLEREVAARESHGGEGRIRAARFPARKSLEEFDFDHARALRRDRPLPAAGDRRGRLHPVRAGGCEPLLPARLLSLRASELDRDVEQAIRPVGGGLR